MNPALRVGVFYWFVMALLAALIQPVRAVVFSPEWLQKLAAAPIPAGEGVPPAWVLLDETTMEIDANGEATETRRVAIRLRVNEAAGKFASGSVYYNSKTGHLLSTEAWLLRKGEALYDKSGSDWTDDSTVNGGTIIDETRARRIDLSEHAVGGDVFGFETRLRRPLLVAQIGAGFGWIVPVQEERFNLILPAGFSIKTFTDGSRPLVATTVPERGRWSWVLHVPDYAPKEPWVAPAARVDAR